jgi:hypothetical protein
MNVEQWWNDQGKTEKTLEKTYPSAPLSTNLTKIYPELSPG